MKGHPFQGEFELKNCGFDPVSVELMVRSQWQSRSKSNIYLGYRWIVAIFVVVVLSISMNASIQSSRFGQFFIYFTNWGVMMNTVVGVLGAVLVTIWHFHADFKGDYKEENRKVSDRNIEINPKRND